MLKFISDSNEDVAPYFFENMHDVYSQDQTATFLSGPAPALQSSGKMFAIFAETK
ncbi:MAG: hypothetical protein MJY91_04135 [Bacteroidales bacterium]|nr:hypothetical protein [Bacteroidales bacterium]